MNRVQDRWESEENVGNDELGERGGELTCNSGTINIDLVLLTLHYRRQLIRYGVVANIIASHAIARGSIPRVGMLLLLVSMENWNSWITHLLSRPNRAHATAGSVQIPDSLLSIAKSVYTS